MNRLFALAGSSYNRVKTNLARRQALNALLRQNDATLRDIGISRELLHGGVECWPWHAIERPPLKASSAAHASTNAAEASRAVRELKGYSDRELRDLGITRDTITEAVYHGRAGAGNPDLAEVPAIGAHKPREVTEYAEAPKAA